MPAREVVKSALLAHFMLVFSLASCGSYPSPPVMTPTFPAAAPSVPVTVAVPSTSTPPTIASTEPSTRLSASQTVALQGQASGPGASDEAADIHILCSGPPSPELDPRRDPTRVHTITAMAALIMEHRLTTDKWHNWLVHFSRDMATTGNPTEVRRRGASELRTVQADCWFAAVLEM